MKKPTLQVTLYKKPTLRVKQKPSVNNMHNVPMSSLAKKKSKRKYA